MECGRRRVSPPAPRLVPRQPGYSPGTRLTRQKGGGGGLPYLHVRPRRQPGRGSPSPYRAGPTGSRPVAQGNLNKDSPVATQRLQQWAFTGPLTTRSQPRQSGSRPLPLQAIPPRPPPPGAPPLIGERSPLTEALAGGLHSFRSPRRPGYRLGYPVKAQQAASPALTGPRPVKASRG